MGKGFFCFLLSFPLSFVFIGALVSFKSVLERRQLFGLGLTSQGLSSLEVILTEMLHHEPP